MLIRKKYVRNLAAYLGSLIPHSDFRFATELSQISTQRLTNSGFAGLNDGAVLLPSIVGRVSRTNAEGRWVVDRNSPKAPRFMGQREWTREEWTGHGQTQTVTTTIDIYRDCYPRTFHAPQGIELTVVDRAGTLFIVSPPLTWQVTPEVDILHVLNLMLELFGETELRHEDLSSFLPPNTRRVNWTLLPPGNTTASVSAHVSALVGRVAPTMRGPAMERLTHLAGHNPPEVYQGHGGFYAYVAYVFPHTGMTVVESVQPANATYVFQGNWSAVAHLTKTQILAGNHHHARIIHDANWEANLRPFVQ